MLFTSDSLAVLYSGKLRSKKLRGKTRGERDVLRERLMRRDNSVPDDKDETSSTTTDSSAGGEQDDKVTECLSCCGVLCWLEDSDTWCVLACGFCVIAQCGLTLQ